MSPGNRPWFVLHDDPDDPDDPGQLGQPGSVRDGSPLVMVGEGVAALASATGPTPATAQETPAIAVRRLSEDNI
jgi:hypothetical protein